VIRIVRFTDNKEKLSVIVSKETICVVKGGIGVQSPKNLLLLSLQISSGHLFHSYNHRSPSHKITKKGLIMIEIGVRPGSLVLESGYAFSNAINNSRFKVEERPQG
jgi:hypothetical protein